MLAPEEAEEEEVIISLDSLGLSANNAFPMQQFMTAIHGKLKAREVISGLSFRGCEMLTDEVFLILYNDSYAASHALKGQVKVLDCTGCVHMTDYSVKKMVDMFPKLTKLNLSGCVQLSEVSLLMIRQKLTKLTELDLTGTAICYAPAWPTEKLSVTVTGCPLLIDQLPRDTPMLNGYSSQPPSKLVIFTKTKWDVLGYLQNSQLSEWDLNNTCKASQLISLNDGGTKNKSVGLPDLAVIECHSKKVLHSPFISERSMYLMVIDMAQENIQLKVMSQLNVLRGQVREVHLVVVAVCSSEDHSVALERLKQVAGDINDYLQQQLATMKTHVQDEYPINNNKDRRRPDNSEDFYWQTCWSRSFTAFEEFSKPSVYIFLVTSKSGQVELVSPKQIPLATGSAQKEENTAAQAEDAVKEALEKWQPTQKEAHAALSTIDKKDISMIRSYTNPPPMVMRVLQMMCILFGEDPSWPNAKRLLGNPSLLPRMTDYDMNSISDSKMRKLEKCLRTSDLSLEKIQGEELSLNFACKHEATPTHPPNPKFDRRTGIKMLMNISSAAAAFYRWVQSCYKYGTTVMPLEKKAQIPKANQPSHDEEDIDKQLEGLMIESQRCVEEAKMAVSSISKADLTEMKMLSKPPKIIQDVTFCVSAALFGQKKNDWAESKRHVSDMQFMSRLMNYDPMTQMTVPIQKVLKPYMEDPNMNPDTAKKVSIASHSFLIWVKRMYEISTEFGPAVKELKERKEMGRSEFVQSKGSSCYPILQCLSMICHRKLNDWRRCEPMLHTGIMDKVLEGCKSATSKIITLDTLLKSLTDVNGKQLIKALHKLHLQGHILFFHDMPVPVVVTNIAWFCTVLNGLEKLKQNEELRNGDSHLNLHADVSIIPHSKLIEHLKEFMEDTKEIDVCVAILQAYGILIPTPVRCPTTPMAEEKLYFLYSHLVENPFTRLSPDECTIRSGHFGELSWPEVTHANHSECDMSASYRFRLTVGIPPSLLPRILAECCAIAPVINVWSLGLIARMGSVEVKITHSVHATMIASSLYIDARQTCFDANDNDHEMIQEHMWSVLSHYVLIVRHQIQRYPYLHARHRIPCQGSCVSSGLGEVFSVHELHPKLGFHIECRRCGANQMEDYKQGYLYGYQPVLPIHNFRDAEDTKYELNAVSPYSAVYGIDKEQTYTLWCCNNCGISKDGSLRLWDMQVSLKPAVASAAFKEIVEKEKERLDIANGVLQTTKEKLQRVFVSDEPFRLNGMCTIQVQVLKHGNIKCCFTSEEYPEKYESLFDLATGELTLKHPDLGMSNSTALPFALAGDVITIKAIDTRLVEQENSDQFMRQVMELWKNDILISTFSIPYRTFLTLTIEGEDTMVLLRCPDYPMIRTEHFPLGSVLLHKTGLGNQWAVAKVVAMDCDKLQVAAMETDGEWQAVAPSSDDILPLVLHNDITIVLGNEMLKTSDHMAKYISSNKLAISHIGLFTKFMRQRKQYSLFPSYHHVQGRPCIVNRHSPQALEQNYMHMLHTEKSTSSSQSFQNFVFLLKELDTEQLLNINRFLVQNWNKQSIMPVCVGNLWGHSALHMRDVHLHDVGTLENNAVPSSVVFCGSDGIKQIMSRYWCLTNLKTLLPSWSTLLPGVFPDVPVDLLLTCLHEMFYLYRQSFVLLYTFYMRNNRKTKMRGNGIKDLMSPYSEHFKGGRCSVHDLVQKKSQMSKPLEEVDPKIMAAAPYVNNITLSHTSIGKNTSKHFGTFLSLFPNIVNLEMHTCGIKSLEGISALSRLEYLLVSGNNIDEVPEEIQKLAPTLIHLDISKNPIRELPDFITKLSMLRTLNAGNTMIRHLPENIGTLTQLRILELKITMVNRLPDSVAQLQRLEVLGLQGVPWIDKKHGFSFDLLVEQNWKDWMKNYKPFLALTEDERMAMFHDADKRKEGGLNQEEQAELSDEIFKRFPRFGETADDKYGGVPSQVMGLRCLRILSLRYQSVRFLPEQLGILRRLDKILMSNNPLLDHIDAGVGKAPLTLVTLDDCPLVHTPPQEIVTQGPRVVVAYLKRLSQGSSACYRTKLMFVGLGGAGKTSLMRALMSGDHTAPMLTAEAITDGIDISTWTINKNNINLQYSVWDFAGQTVYYNTHQFFLSRRAVYVLVWNTRLGFEHAGLEFWLSSIACHCPDSPIFVVGTHADQITTSEVPAEDLKKRHPNIKAFFTVSSIKGTGVKDLLDKLVDVTLEQPYMGGMIPEPWLNFERLILMKRSKDSLLMWKDVKKMANSCGILGSEIRQAVHFIHELGSLQYFENELLKDRIVINPQWIVKVMACIVSVHNKVITDGRLRHRDISRIWKDYPKDIHQWLLRLTEVFDLTFPLGEEPVNMVPCLLPQKQPTYDWPEMTDEMRETKMLYKFAYLPAGLFNRVQVRLYEFSESSAMWKAGSILKKNGHQAVIKQLNETSVEVRVQGHHPDNILLLIHEVIESLINDFFHGVKYEYHIPCSDCIKIKTEEPTMFSSKVLRKAIELKALFLQCHTFFHTLAIQDVQSAMPPVSGSDYNLQIQNAVRELENLEQDLAFDVFFLYCENDIPSEEQRSEMVGPVQIRNELQREGFKCYFSNEMETMSAEQVAISMKKAKVILVLISNEFVASEACQRMFRFAKESLQKDIQLCMLGTGREWMKSEFIGIQVTEQVFVNFQRIPQFNEKIKELTGKLKNKFMVKKDTEEETFDVFLSYAWVNSASAIALGHARPQEGSVGHGDPRQIKKRLEEAGYKVWLDVDQVGRMGLFKDIATGMKKSRLVIACISDEYALSENCQMEFRFAHVALKKPIILAVVGTGFRWESTEIGMLSLGYHKINYQVANSIAAGQLMQSVKESVELIIAEEEEDAAEDDQPKNTKQISKEQAFQELYEMAQRKFLRQLSSYTSQMDPFPRLFVADINREEDEDDDGEKGCGGEAKEQDKIIVDDLQPGQFCIRLLCEHEKGWHSVGPEASIPVGVGGSELVQLWKLTAPYMARIIAIIKHSNIDLNIIKSPAGQKIINMLDMKSGSDLTVDIKPIYLELRKFIMRKDSELTQGQLKRCYLPSGKVLWLCSEHQQLPRVTILDDDDPDEGESNAEEDGAEANLLDNLKRLHAGGKTKGIEKAGPDAKLSARPKSSRSKEKKATKKQQQENKTMNNDTEAKVKESEALETVAKEDTKNEQDAAAKQTKREVSNTTEGKEGTIGKAGKMTDGEKEKPDVDGRTEPAARHSGAERAQLGKKISIMNIASSGSTGETSKACNIL